MIRPPKNAPNESPAIKTVRTVVIAKADVPNIKESSLVQTISYIIDENDVIKSTINSNFDLYFSTKPLKKYVIQNSI